LSGITFFHPILIPLDPAWYRGIGLVDDYHRSCRKHEMNHRDFPFGIDDIVRDRRVMDTEVHGEIQSYHQDMCAVLWGGPGSWRVEYVLNKDLELIKKAGS
jgi:hypothetical protein